MGRASETTEPGAGRHRDSQAPANPSELTNSQGWGHADQAQDLEPKQRPVTAGPPGHVGTHFMTLSNSIARTSCKFVSEGISRLEEREICIHQTSAASQIPSRALHTHQGFEPETRVLQVTLAAPSPHAIPAPCSTSMPRATSPSPLLPGHTTMASSSLAKSNSCSMVSPNPLGPPPLLICSLHGSWGELREE